MDDATQSVEKPTRKHRANKENLVPLNVMVTPNHKHLMEKESEMTGMSLSLIARKALDEHFADTVAAAKRRDRRNSDGTPYFKGDCQ